MTDIRVQIGSPNGDGKRSIVYRHGDKEYPDHVDVGSGWQREQSIRRALPALGIDPDQYRAIGGGTTELAILDAEVARLAKEADAKAVTGEEHKERFPLISSQALDSEDYTPSPIITEALFAGSPAVIGGMYKTGKTLLGIDAAISIATGLPFLGSYTVPEPRVVVYFTGEGGPAVAQEYGRRIAASKGIKLADVTQLHWCFSVPRLENMGDLSALAKVLDNTAAEVPIFDNLMLCLSGDNAGNVYSMGGVLGQAVRVCSERAATPVFVHHFKRTRSTADPFAPGELADLTQAGVAEIAGQWLLLARRQPYNHAEVGEHKLWLTIGGRMGHSSLAALNVHEGSRADPGGRRWEVDVLRPEDARNAVADQREQEKAEKLQQQIEADKKKVLRAMASLERQHPEGNATTAIRDRSYLKGARFTAALEAIVTDGHAVECEFQRSNHKTLSPGYKLAGDEA